MSAQSTPSGPLVGLRVVELAGIGPGPLACKLLADLGADVLRVERAGGGAVKDGLHTGRPVLVADLKNPADLERVKAAVAVADVLVEGFRPGTTERLGLGPSDLMEANPRLVYARMTGWGQHGPLAMTAGHDINYLSLTGALHAIGEADGKPVAPLNLVADFGGGTMFCVVGILAALHSRTVTGHGQVVDAAMVDGASYLMSMTWSLFGAGGWVDRRESNLLDGGAPFYDTYRCSDGGYLAVGALEPQFYAALLAGLDLADDETLPAQMDLARWPELTDRIAARIAERTRDEWADVFAGTDACATPVLSMTQAAQAEHLTARGTLPTVAGATMPAPAPRFAGTPAGGADYENVAGGADVLARWGADRPGQRRAAARTTRPPAVHSSRRA